jgi:hypothetical protein
VAEPGLLNTSIDTAPAKRRAYHNEKPKEGKEAEMTNDKVQHARELLRIALDMLDESEAFMSGALVAGALDSLGEAPRVEAMALAIERGRPAFAAVRSCA